MRGLFTTALCAGKALNRLSTRPKVRRQPRGAAGSPGPRPALLLLGFSMTLPRRVCRSHRSGSEHLADGSGNLPNPLGEAADP